MIRQPRLRWDPRLRFIVVIVAVFALAALFSGQVMAQETWTVSFWNNMSLSGSPVYQRAESGP
ncbi:MAG: hypothetical protein ACK2UK_02105, partial [Candidatus Promineifilaceae bacterium]